MATKTQFCAWVPISVSYNRVYETDDLIVEACCGACGALIATLTAIQSIATRALDGMVNTHSR